MRVMFCTVGMLALLCSCSSGIKDAERELHVIEKSGGTSSELCRAHKKVADAYLKAQDESGYKFAKMLADSQCLNAKLEGGL